MDAIRKPGWIAGAWARITTLPFWIALAASAGLAVPTSAQQHTGLEEDRGGLLTLDALGESADEGNWRFLARFRKNLRFTADLYWRGNVLDRADGFFQRGGAGIDMHKVFSGEKGDWGTAVLQVYITRITNQPNPAPFFESEDDWELEFRIFNFNYTGLSGSAVSFRVGHFELPYGLEQVINTNGTLRQYTPLKNLGQKLGWGATINGVLQRFNYEIGLTYGDELEFNHNSNQYTVSGRLGSPRDENWEAGVSAFYGRELPDADERARIGFDGQYHFGQWSILGELSIGRDWDPERDVVNLLVEQDWHSRNESVLVYVQLRTSFQDPARTRKERIRSLERLRHTLLPGPPAPLAEERDYGLTYALGVRWVPDSHWAYSAQLSQDIDAIGGTPRSTTLSFQLRYRF